MAPSRKTGDILIFPDVVEVPDVVTTQSVDNDLPASNVYNQIRITGGGYTFTGNTIRLTDGIVLDPSTAVPANYAPTTRLQNDLVLHASQNIVAQGIPGLFVDLRVEGNVDLQSFTLTVRTDQSTSTDIDRVAFGGPGLTNIITGSRERHQNG